MTLLSDISERMRIDIASGRLALGERVTIDNLSVRYGASHMPVREALRRLTGEGLIAMEPGRGARIRQVDPDFVANLFDTRIALEGTLSRSAARLGTDVEIAQLITLEDERKLLVDQKDFSGALLLNRTFHALIHRMGRNPQAAELIEQTWVLIVALWHHYGYGQDRFAGVASDHLNLIRALKARDSDAASILTSAHVTKTKFDLLAQMEADAPRLIKKTKSRA